MSMYKEIKQSFQNEYKERAQIYTQRLAQWNAQSPVTRVERPTNLARARELGYKAKQGVVIVRVRVKGGKKKRETPHGGRKPSKSGRYFSIHKSLQAIAEERAARKFANCEVVNSYFVGQAGSTKFYEVILADRTSPSIMSDRQLSGVTQQRNRAFRGMTSAGAKHRGLLHKGFGTEGVRPSMRQNRRR
ncbi:MAG: 50S ribosomal protein L15e [Candidatus Micrarchaeota archaeon]|nr:50S ribosomal protein L15e [Candidatus Micrarchaeota archaeon]